jgi:hypothetical protein
LIGIFGGVLALLVNRSIGLYKAQDWFACIYEPSVLILRAPLCIAGKHFVLALR